jgi:hypothetical protein
MRLRELCITSESDNDEGFVATEVYQTASFWHPMALVGMLSAIM